MDKNNRVANREITLLPTRWRDMWPIVRLVYASMMGMDRDFTAMVNTPWRRAVGYVWIPFYLHFSGSGVKAVLPDDGTIVGCAYLHLQSISGYIFNVNVHAAYRRCGLGERMMTHLEEELQAQGMPWVALEVDGHNHPAQQLYTKLGYRAYHPHYFFYPHPVLPAWTAHPAATLIPFADNPLTHYRHHLHQEILQGDRWVAPLVLREYTPRPPVGGRHWRCLWEGEDRGHLWLSDEREGEVSLFFWLDPPLWEEHALSGWLSLLGEMNLISATLSLHLGSEAHFEKVAPWLRNLGWEVRYRRRFLMAKGLD